MRDGSNLSRLTTLELSESFGGKPVEATLRRVTFDLPIPSLPIVLQEPIAERREFLGTQLFNFTLESFNLRHVTWNCTTWPRYSAGSKIDPYMVELNWMKVTLCRSSVTETLQ